LVIEGRARLECFCFPFDFRRVVQSRMSLGNLTGILEVAEKLFRNAQRAGRRLTLAPLAVLLDSH